jgi:hypothetical protein
MRIAWSIEVCFGNMSDLGIGYLHDTTLQNILMFYGFLVIPDKYQCTIYVIEI